MPQGPFVSLFFIQPIHLYFSSVFYASDFLFVSCLILTRRHTINQTTKSQSFHSLLFLSSPPPCSPPLLIGQALKDRLVDSARNEEPWHAGLMWDDVPIDEEQTRPSTLWLTYKQFSNDENPGSNETNENRKEWRKTKECRLVDYKICRHFLFISSLALMSSFSLTSASTWSFRIPLGKLGFLLFFPSRSCLSLSTGRPLKRRVFSSFCCWCCCCCYDSTRRRRAVKADLASSEKPTSFILSFSISWFESVRPFPRSGLFRPSEPQKGNKWFNTIVFPSFSLAVWVLFQTDQRNTKTDGRTDGRKKKLSDGLAALNWVARMVCLSLDLLADPTNTIFLCRPTLLSLYYYYYYSF